MTIKRLPQPTEWPVALSSDQLVAHLATAVFAVDLSGRFIHVNPAGSALIGYPPSRLIGLHFERLFVPEQLPGIREQFLRAAVRGERVVGYETAVVRKDGTTADVGLTGGPLYEDGRIVAVVGMAEDISARKRLERQLARVQRARATLSACGHALARATDEHELLREVCRLIADTGGCLFAWVGYAESDPDRTVRPVAAHGADNGYLARIRVTWADNHWGQGPVGTHSHPRTLHRAGRHHASRRSPGQALRAAHTTSPIEARTYLLEKRDVRSDGEIVWAKLTSSPVRDASGRICRHIGVIEDITQRKTAERALEARTEDLNERVKELHCLYAVSRVIQEVQIDSRGVPTSLFQRIVTVIPSAMRFVEHAAARLIIGHREFRTRSYAESAAAIHTAIQADGRTVGSLEICYVGLPETPGEDAFLPDERELLVVLAEQIGKLLERETASRVLKRERDLRDRLIETSPAGIVMLDRDGRITLANARAAAGRNAWSRSRTSTSTTSSASTTRSATKSATTCSSPSPAG